MDKKQKQKKQTNHSSWPVHDFYIINTPSLILGRCPGRPAAAPATPGPLPGATELGLLWSPLGPLLRQSPGPAHLGCQSSSQGPSSSGWLPVWLAACVVGCRATPAAAGVAGSRASCWVSPGVSHTGATEVTEVAGSHRIRDFHDLHDKQGALLRSLVCRLLSVPLLVHSACWS